jgi:hypothetical protein
MILARKSGLCIAVFLALAAPAVAQDNFPSRPIKFVVPLAAGGGIDFTARVTAQRLSERARLRCECFSFIGLEELAGFARRERIDPLLDEHDDSGAMLLPHALGHGMG